MNPLPHQPDIFFAQTPTRVVAEMLRLAAVGPEDIVFDLGCGDGQIVIAAAQICGARGLGVDIDPQLLAQATAQAAQAGVTNLVRFVEQDLFETDLREATVIALYLLDSLNVRLRPQILAQCAPGTRVVSYSFEMGDWEPEAHTPIAANGVSLWVVPAEVRGVWRGPAGDAGLESLELDQVFQKVTGTAYVRGEARRILEGRVLGRRFHCTIVENERHPPLLLSGEIEGERLEATLGNEMKWSAKKLAR